MNTLKKIAIIMPKGSPYRFGPHNQDLQPDSLTIRALVGLIPKELHVEAEVYDETVELIEKEKIRVDLVAISSMTPTIHRAYAYADYFRAQGIPVVIGGVHASLFPDEAAEHADAVVIGVAAQTWPRLLFDFKSGKMKKRYTQESDLDNAVWPHPDRSCYEKKGFSDKTINSVQVSYGCLNYCGFCVQPYVAASGFRRNLDDAIEEIKGIQSFIIELYDPNLTKDQTFFEDFCKRIQPLKKRWMLPMTIDMSDNPYLLKLAVKSGCKGVLVGFESINQDSLQGVNKRLNTVEKYKKAIRNFQKYGLLVAGSFVMGLDNDDSGTFRRTLDFINGAGIDFPRFTINTAYPGTPYYKSMKAQNRLIETDWALYDCWHVVIQPKNMTVDELQNGYYWIWEHAYTLRATLKRLLIRPWRLNFPVIFLLILLARIFQASFGRKMSYYSKEIVADISDI